MQCVHAYSLGAEWDATPGSMPHSLRALQDEMPGGFVVVLFLIFYYQDLFLLYVYGC